MIAEARLKWVTLQDSLIQLMGNTGMYGIVTAVLNRRYDAQRNVYWN